VANRSASSQQARSFTHGIEILTFDCYGTLIDWETGILSALRPVLRRHEVGCGDEDLLRHYGELEPGAERGPFVPYRTVLGRVVEALGRRLGFAPEPDEIGALAASLPRWEPFADTVPALRALGSRYRLGVISNVDDDLFAGSAGRLGVRFDWVVTAQSVGAYKPSPRMFEAALERIGPPAGRVLHVAQSLFHDIAPARALGLPTVWVNRRVGRSGSGATPPADARPDAEVADLDGLVRMLLPG